MGGTHYFVLRLGGGRVFVTLLHFTTKSTDVYIITTYNRILHTSTPAQYTELNSIKIGSASLKHVWLHISGQACPF